VEAAAGGACCGSLREPAAGASKPLREPVPAGGSNCSWLGTGAWPILWSAGLSWPFQAIRCDTMPRPEERGSCRLGVEFLPDRLEFGVVVVAVLAGECTDFVPLWTAGECAAFAPG